MAESIRWQAVVLAIFLSLPNITFAASPRTLTATITRVADGDAVTATIANGTKLRFRLLSIDAHEIAHGRQPGQPLGQAGQDCLDHLIGGRTIRVETRGPDKYKRILAVLWDGQVNVNPFLVALGYAKRIKVSEVWHIDKHSNRRSGRFDRYGQKGEARGIMRSGEALDGDSNR